MNPKYSICITHYNDAFSARQSLESILNQIADDFEVVVVDQSSTDGSLDVLEEFAQEGQIALYRQRFRNRGLGRQLAFEMSRGGYVLSNLDLDDVFLPNLSEFVSLYHANCEGMFLWNTKGGSIAPRSLIVSLGGWRNLQYSEDFDLASRAAQIGKFRNTRYRLIALEGRHPERHTRLGEMKFTYLYEREQMLLRAYPKNRPDDQPVLIR